MHVGFRLKLYVTCDARLPSISAIFDCSHSKLGVLAVVHEVSRQVVGSVYMRVVQGGVSNVIPSS